MRYPKAARLELAASKDDTRPHLNQVYLDVEAVPPVLVATSGHVLALVPVELHPDDVTGPIALDALADARKAAGRGADAVCELRAPEGGTRSVDGVIRPRGGEDFPPYKRVMVDYDGQKDCVSIGLDAKLLWELAQALGCKKDDGVVVLTFPQDTSKIDPIQVRRDSLAKGADAVRGILMPCRLGVKP